MKNLQLYYPTKPYIITQKWGVRNPIYKQFGFNLHNGQDFRYGHDKLLYSELPCEVINADGYQPRGGGIYMTVRSLTPFRFPDGIEAHVKIDYLHLEKVLVKKGDLIGIGRGIAVPDNTGLSTGAHTHSQYRRVKFGILGWYEVDKNDANNSFDPTTYRNGIYAVDFRRIQKNLAEQKKTYNLLSIIIEKLLALIN